MYGFDIYVSEISTLMKVICLIDFGKILDYNYKV